MLIGLLPLSSLLQCTYVKALYPYTASNSDELTFVAGDVLEQYGQATEGWHHARHPVVSVVVCLCDVDEGCEVMVVMVLLCDVL